MPQNINEYQKKIIQGILNNPKNKEEFKKDAAFLSFLGKSKDSDKELLLEPLSQDLLMDASIANINWQSTSIDTWSLLLYLNDLNKTNLQHKKLASSHYSNALKNISHIEKSIKENGVLSASSDSEDVLLELFDDNSNIEGHSPSYTNESGETISRDFICSYSENQAGITLPMRGSNNLTTERMVTDIQKTFQSAAEYSVSTFPYGEVHNILNEEGETFWIEQTIVDEPIETDLGPEFYNSSQGAHCKLEITLASPARINEVTVEPFSSFPIEILAIIGYNEKNEPIEIVSPLKTDNHLKNTFISSAHSFQFQTCIISKIEVIIAQPHYTEIIISPSNHEIIATQMILASLNNKEINYLEYGKELLNDEKITTEIKYIYSYGMSNISLMYNEYEDYGVYVSKPYENMKTIKGIEILAEESHPNLANIDKRVTNIEYYISHNADSPSPTWTPICPKNSPAIIEGSLKVIDDYLSPQFGIQEILNIYEDSRKMMSYEYSLITPINIVISEGLKSNSIYTADYIPREEHKEIDFISLHKIGSEIDGITEIEEILSKGTQNVFNLKFQPFTNYNKIYSMPPDYNPSVLADENNNLHYVPIKVQIIKNDGTEIWQPLTPQDINDENLIKIINKTDYFNISTESLNIFDAAIENYEYFIIEDKLFFNCVLPKDYRITIEYERLSNQVSLKAIMKRNSDRYYGLTPLLKEFAIIPKTI